MTSTTSPVAGPALTRLAWLAVAAATATIALKTLAWALTGSVGLLSDALESVVNLVAALLALVVLRWAAKPADEEHAYGHAKAEYISAGVEGTLIFLAAASIAWTATSRLLDPAPLEDVGLGLAVSAAASLINLAVGLLLVRTGRRHRSITLEADGRHLLTDVWTSVGVVLGVVAVALTDWQHLDPIIALVVAANILLTGASLVRRATGGLMDRALPANERADITHVLDRYAQEGTRFHALRTRQAGRRSFMSVHVLVPGHWTVQRGHDLIERLETDLRRASPHLTVFTHLEPLEDPASLPTSSSTAPQTSSSVRPTCPESPYWAVGVDRLPPVRGGSSRPANVLTPALGPASGRLVWCWSQHSRRYGSHAPGERLRSSAAPLRRLSRLAMARPFHNRH